MWTNRYRLKVVLAMLACILMITSPLFQSLPPILSSTSSVGSSSSTQPFDAVRLTRNDYNEILMLAQDGSREGTFGPRTYGGWTAWVGSLRNGSTILAHSSWGTSGGSEIIATNITSFPQGLGSRNFVGDNSVIQEFRIQWAGDTLSGFRIPVGTNPTALSVREGIELHQVRAKVRDAEWRGKDASVYFIQPGWSYPSQSWRFAGGFVASLGQDNSLGITHTNGYPSGDPRYKEVSAQFGVDEIYLWGKGVVTQVTRSDHRAWGYTYTDQGQTIPAIGFEDPTRPEKLGNSVNIAVNENGHVAWAKTSLEWINYLGTASSSPRNYTLMIDDRIVTASLLANSTFPSNPFGVRAFWGQLLLYTIRDYRTNRESLWLYDENSDRHLRLEGLEQYWQKHGTLEEVSSDGRKLAWVQEDERGFREVYYYDGTTTKRLTLNNVHDFFPVVDGRWLAYLNQTGGRYYLNLYDMEGGGRVRGFNASVVDWFGSLRHFLSWDFRDGLLVWALEEYTRLDSDSPVSIPINLFVYNAWTDTLTSMRLEGISRVWGGGAWDLRLRGSGALVTSAGWIFMTAVPEGEEDLEVYAFQPLRGQVSVYPFYVYGGQHYLPLKEVRVDIDLGGERLITAYTDRNGYFSVPVFQRLSAMNPPPTFRVNLTQREGKFTIISYERTDDNNIVTYSTNDTALVMVNDFFVKLNATELGYHPRTQTSMQRRQNIVDAAYIYYRTYQAYELARDVLKADTYLDRRLDVRIFSPAAPPTDGVWFNEIDGRPVINIDERGAPLSDDDQPDNREWHEFGHALVWFSPIGGIHHYPQRQPGDANHGMYQNDESLDSFLEGFAEFYSLLVADLVDKEASPQFYYWAGQVSNLDWNYPNWEDEEFAAAGILWDIYDSTSGVGRDDDGISINARQLWQRLVSANVINMLDLWQAFKDVPNVNQTFVGRKVFDDLNGNSLFDANEPIGTSGWSVVWLDRNGNGANDAGETVATTRATDIMAATDRFIIHWFGRPDRPPISGSGVLLDLIDKDVGGPIQDVRVNVTVLLPEPYGPYSYYISLPNSSSRFNMHVPSHPNSSTLITIYSQGYNPSSQILVNSSFYLARVYENIYLLNRTRPNFLTVSGTLEKAWEAIRMNVYEVAWEGQTYPVAVASSSTVSNLSFSQPLKQISYTVQGPSGKDGFSNITILNALLGGPYITQVDGQVVKAIVKSNSTHSILYISYSGGTHNIGIIGAAVIPEFPSGVLALLTILLAITLISTYRVRRAKSHIPKNSYVLA